MDTSEGAGTLLNHAEQDSAVVSYAVSKINSKPIVLEARTFTRSSYSFSAEDRMGSVEHEQLLTMSKETRQLRVVYRRLVDPSL